MRSASPEFCDHRFPGPRWCRAIVIACVLTVFAASSGRLFSQSESAEPAEAIVDDAAVFRSHPDLKEQLSSEIESLHRDTGVTVRLITVAFLANGPPSKRARELATEWSADRPAAALIYVRGNRSAGYGINPPLEQMIPAFELASLTPPPADEQNRSNRDDKVDAALELAQSLRAFMAVTRRHFGADDGGSQAGESSARSDSSASPARPSQPGAKLRLLMAVLLAAAGIVTITAWTSRRHSASH